MRSTVVVILLLVVALVPLLRTASDDPRLAQLPRPVPRADGGLPGIGPGPTPASSPALIDTETAGAQPGARPEPVGPSAEPAPDHSPSSIVVSLRDPADTSAVTSRGGTVVGEIAGTGFVVVRPVGDPVTFVDELAQDPAVLAVSLDYARRKAAAPNDALYPQYQQAYLDLVRMPQAWDLQSSAVSQVVAVLDTGVDGSHEDLAGRLVAGFNAVTPGAGTSDTDGHGTVIAGVIAANTDNGIGMAGVTWTGRVMPIKVFASEVAFDSDIARGLVWAVDHGADVINLSLGGPGNSPLLHTAVRYATDRNVVVVAAAGNEGSEVAQYPAAFPEVLAVGATDASGKLVDFSSYGEWLDLAAPGFDVVSTFPGHGYVFADGTSFAAPIVAGVAALVRAQNPALTQAQVGDRLRAAARDAGPRGVDPFYGWGVLDAARALGASFAPDLPLPDLGPHEPNDVPERATAISASGMNGSLAVEGDADWYRLDAVAPRLLYMIVRAAPFDGDLGQNADHIVDVYNEDLALIATVDEFGPGVGEGVAIGVPAGTTYLRVRNANGAADPRAYALEFPSSEVVGPASGFETQTVALQFGARAVAIGDVTGDGHPDVVGLERSSSGQPDGNRFAVLAGRGDDGVAEPVWYEPIQIGVPSLALADIDQDGALDVVLGGNLGVEWFRQVPGVGLVGEGLLLDGTDGVFFVVAADLDGDGDSDLVGESLNASGSRLIVLTHGAGASFTYAEIPDSSDTVTGRDLAVGDLDGDGHADVARILRGRLYIHHREDDGWRRTEHTGPVPGAFDYLDIGDVTGDGLIDAVVPDGARVNVFRQNEDGSLADPVAHAVLSAASVAIGDIDGDGRNDVSVINRSAGGVSFLFQQPDGSLAYTGHVLVPVSAVPAGQALAIADLDGDGREDIAAALDTAITVLRYPDTTHPGTVVRSVSPVEYSTGVSLAVTPGVVFASGVDVSSVHGGSVRLVDGRTGALVAGSVSFDPGSGSATFTPAGPLDRAKPYRIVVDGVTAGGLPVSSFASTFTTVGSGGLPPLRDFVVRGRVGAAASVSAVVPVGDVGDVVVRYAEGSVPPASPSAGLAGYAGVGGGIVVGGLTPGRTYSFAVWYRDRGGSLSPRSTATLIGTSVVMSGWSAGAGAGTVPVTFTGTVTTPTGPGVGVPVSLVAACAEGPWGGSPVATVAGDDAGLLSVTLSLGAPRCGFRWEIDGSSAYMGGSTKAVRIMAGPNLPPGDTPPRQR